MPSRRPTTSCSCCRATRRNTTALKSLASLAYQQSSGAASTEEKIARLDKAAEWYQKLAAADPNEKEAFYSLGVIAWAKFYPAWMSARGRLGMRPEAPGPIKDKKVREELTAAYGTVIADGIKNLEKALEIDKEYDDAMAYLNLLHREHADLADNDADCKKETELADSFMSKALETRKVKAERAPKANGIANEAPRRSNPVPAGANAGSPSSLEYERGARPGVSSLFALTGKFASGPTVQTDGQSCHCQQP